MGHVDWRVGAGVGGSGVCRMAVRGFSGVGSKGNVDRLRPRRLLRRAKKEEKKRRSRTSKRAKRAKKAKTPRSRAPSDKRQATSDERASPRAAAGRGPRRSINWSMAGRGEVSNHQSESGVAPVHPRSRV